MINKERILKWVEALESEKYKQAYAALRKADGSMCCLGVACEISTVASWETDQEYYDYIGVEAKYNYITEKNFLPLEVAKYYGFVASSIIANKGEEIYIDPTVLVNEDNEPNLTSKRVVSLTELNDSARLTFKEIAKILRKNFLTED